MMRRLIAVVVLAAGLAVAGAPPAAAAYNTAPAYNICRYWQSDWVLFEWRDVDFGGTGFYYAHVWCRWRFNSGGSHWEAEGLYRRRDGYHTITVVRCLSGGCAS
jgi:hypothetical protein